MSPIIKDWLRRVGHFFAKLVRIKMRAVLAILPLVALSACANPWTVVPEAELPKPVRIAMARPSPFVFGNYCGPGTRTGDLSPCQSPRQRLPNP